MSKVDDVTTKLGDVSLTKKINFAERTFIMVKPDGVQRGLVGEIIKRFEQRGFKLIAIKMMTASKTLLEQHYKDLAQLAFFPKLVADMSSGPVVPMIFEGFEAVKTGRMILGATKPIDSLPGTIRGDFCQCVGANIVHGSDAVETAKREIELWFSESDIASYKLASSEFVHVA